MEEQKTKRNLRKRISADQLEYMITYMEENPDLKNGILTPTFTKNVRKRKWEELAKSLNALVGSVKTTDLWKKAWNDQKTYVRAKAVKLRQSQELAGSSSSEKLSAMEERILNLVGIPGAEVSRVTENKAPSDTEILLSDEETRDEVVHTELLFSEEESETTEKTENNVPVKSIRILVPDCTKKPPLKRPKMTLCGMTAATLDELRRHGESISKNAKTQEEILGVLKVISGSLHSISANLERIADVAVNRI